MQQAMHKNFITEYEVVFLPSYSEGMKTTDTVIYLLKKIEANEGGIPVYHSQEQQTFSYEAEINYESAMFARWTEMGPLRLTALSLKCLVNLSSFYHTYTPCCPAHV